MAYNWQLPDWPHFTYDVHQIQPVIMALAQEMGEVNGIVMSLPNELKEETLLQLMLSEAVKTSAIEGEFISREDVMSSIRNNLGLNAHPVLVKDKRAGGVAQLMVAVRNSFAQPLQLTMLLDWHHLLMAGAKHINPGQWRTATEPMQVVSGVYGREVVHYQAPPSVVVPQQMEGFVHWYNHAALEQEGSITGAVVKSAVAHLYFESIHPFEDGNGRIGRAIAEKALSQTIGRPVMLSLSKIIEEDKAAYYTALKDAQATLQITEWINYFAHVVLAAQRDAKAMVLFTLKKAQFFNRYQNQLNPRQLKAISKMMEKGSAEFQGGMTALKYISINKTSKATATRDLQQLQTLGVLQPQGAGRSVSYQLNWG
jgi:Fic family protein